MLAQLKTGMQLQTLEPVRVVEPTNGHITLTFDLPRFGLSLVILENAG